MSAARSGDCDILRMFAIGASIVFSIEATWLSRHDGTEYLSVLVNFLSS